jgi:lysophospholipase L1-like esterase
MTLHPGLLLLFLLLPAPEEDPFLGIIQRWQAMDAAEPEPAGAILFVGSSSIRRWESLTLAFDDYEIIQRGFGGSNWSDLVDKADEIVLPYQPAAIVVYGGSNLLVTGGTAFELFEDYVAFVQKVHTLQNQSAPPIPILTFGLTPNPSQWWLWSEMEQFNSLVQAYTEPDPSLFYIDTPSIFLATGSPPASYLFAPDQHHLSREGYLLWESALRPVLASVVPPNKVYVPNALHPAGAAQVLIDLGPDDGDDGVATGVDANGNHWNNWWAPTAGGFECFTGEHVDGLVAKDGSPTGFHLTLTGSFYPYGLQNGGLTNPSPALLGKLAIATATEDYFAADTWDSPGGIAIEGLDPARSYDLRFFASVASPDTQTTRYVVRGASEKSTTLQVSGPGSGTAGNSNDDTVATVEDMRPDAFGRIVVDVDLVNGLKCHVGIVEIDVDPLPPTGKGLRKAGQTPTPVSR